MNLVLIGFTSCGKSAVGKVIAHRLNYQFLDLDLEIIQLDKHKRSCREIFIQDGEDAFRKLEAQALQNCSSLTKTVLSTGGGTPLCIANHSLLNTIGKIVWINASAKTLFDRMKIKKGLPAFLQNNPTVEYLQEILNQRTPIYKQLANSCINTDLLTIEEVADKILAEFNFIS